MIPAGTGAEGVGVPAGAISTQRQTNMHTVLNLFVSASFCTVFCKLLSSQASSSLIFGINFFSVCIFFCVSVFFFFKSECFYWTTFLLFVHIYITSIKLSKFKMPKVHHSHRNQKNTNTRCAVHSFPIMSCFLHLCFQVLGLCVCVL